MKILIEMGHPAHVHHFKNMIWELERKGHDVCICAIDKEVTLDLLNKYGFNYEVLGKNHKKGIMLKLPLLIKSEIKMLKIAKKFNPELIICRCSPVSAHISKILRKTCISFNDTEHSELVDSIVFPFLDVILTPDSFKKDLGEKQVRYNGYKELAYLHPNYFTPNQEVLGELGLEEDDPFMILRFVSWGASHDVGQHGIKNKVELVRELEGYGRVLITSEGRLPKMLEEYKIKVSPEKLHDLLYYASLYIGEGGTMASEAAVLGTHAIHISTTAKYCGIFRDLSKYDLMWISEDEDAIIDKAIEILQKNDIRTEGKRKRMNLLKNKIDVTSFMVWFVENYPESSAKIRENPSFQDKFK